MLLNNSQEHDAVITADSYFLTSIGIFGCMILKLQKNATCG
jgi:hypothetical protein